MSSKIKVATEIIEFIVPLCRARFMDKLRKNKILYIIMGVIGSIVIITLGLMLHFYQVAFNRNNQLVNQVRSSSPNYSLIKKFDKLPKSNESLINDNLKLYAWYVPAEYKTNNTVILVHGFHQNKSSMRQYGQLFHELGYNVLMPDNRGVGQSQGKFISFGYHEKYDVIAWVDYLTEKNYESHISLYGVSMGATTVMMASSEKSLPLSVKNIIGDSGYTNAWDEMVYKDITNYNIPSFTLTYKVSLEKIIDHTWFFREASATKALSKDKLPILLIHGSKDTVAPISMVYKNYKAVKKGTPKEILIIKGASHAKSFETSPKIYRQTISKFMTTYNP